MRTRKKRKCRVACLQLCATADWRGNFESICEKISAAVDSRARIIVLPENCLYRGEVSGLSEIAERVVPEVIGKFRHFARLHSTDIVLGGVPEKTGIPGKFYNTAYHLSATGDIAAVYRKIHLFDSALPRACVFESRHIVPGKKAVVSEMAGVRAGFAVCYDLRFPELFRRLTLLGARVIFVTANFTEETGRAHWEILLRARAIENQVFIVAAGQIGLHPETGIRSFGTSLAVDPWGRILAKAPGRRSRVMLAELDFDRQEALRKVFPVLKHIRLSCR
jgi:predicted amidohydrolase